jgi:hypothetical protein
MSIIHDARGNLHIGNVLGKPARDPPPGKGGQDSAALKWSYNPRSTDSSNGMNMWAIAVSATDGQISWNRASAPPTVQNQFTSDGTRD